LHPGHGLALGVVVAQRHQGRGGLCAADGLAIRAEGGRALGHAGLLAGDLHAGDVGVTVHARLGRGHARVARAPGVEVTVLTLDLQRARVKLVGVRDGLRQHALRPDRPVRHPLRAPAALGIR
ncbi:MAG: hypothetical protein ACK559_38930, partial [bacterium]